jgi:RNA recognition motif-containing protein
MKLLIRNLARKTTEDDVNQLFAAFGAVQSCTIVLDAKTKQSKGFGFVTMSNQGEAKAAMKSLNGTIVAGSKIRVKKAEVIC